MTTSVSENFKTLQPIEKDIKFMVKSVIRLELLKTLENSTYTVKELANNTGMCYSSISTNLNKLEEKKYIRKTDKKFETKQLTSLYLENILEFDQTLAILEDFKPLWLKHDIKEFNENARTNLNSLKNAQLVESTPIDIYKTHNTIKKQLLSSKNIKLIFPYLHPEYPSLIKESLKNGAKIEGIISKEIYDEFYYKIKKMSENDDSLNVYTIENSLNIYLTICDDYMSLGLFKNDGSFDQNRILVSTNKEALKWANELFESMKEKTMEEKNEFN